MGSANRMVTRVATFRLVCSVVMLTIGGCGLAGAKPIAGTITGVAFAQQPFGTIVGTVTDPTGAPLPSTTVTVANTYTRVDRTVVASATGDYSVPYLDAVQGLRSSAFETNDLARGITAIAEDLTTNASASDSPAIEVEVEGGPRQLNPVVREEAYRIASEALRNAFRHARARRIAVEIRYEKRQFRLRVRDDGKGLDEEIIRRQQAGHFGLPGLRERAEVVGGRLEVRSRMDSGTEVELTIPGAIAYGQAARRSWLTKVLSRQSRDNEEKSHE